MKKSLIALAVIGAFTGLAQAQQQPTGVSIYGSIDGGIRYQSDAAPAGDIWSMGARIPSGASAGIKQGTYNTNRLGFKGVEDLGGGMNAHFVLENGFDTSTGGFDTNPSRLFQRSAFVGLGGGWGNLDFGRQYSVAFKTIGTYEPFNYKYTSIIPLSGAAAGSAFGNTVTTAAPGVTATSTLGTFGGTRFDNDVQYTAIVGPATLRAEYSFGEQAGAFRNNQAWAVGTGFATGPVSLGAAYTKKRPNVGTLIALPAGTTSGTASFQDNTQWTVGGAFKAAAFRVAAGYLKESQERGVAGFAENEQKNAWAGVTFNLSPAVELTGAFYQTKLAVGTSAAGTTVDGRRNLFIVGGTYALSKRTVIYSEVDYAKLRGIARVGATLVTAGGPAIANPADNQKGVTIGINHLF